MPWSSRANTSMPADSRSGYRAFYRGRRVLITGGMGFIGSNLARQLVELNADVVIVDSMIPDYGGNLFYIAGREDRGRCNFWGRPDESTMVALAPRRAVTFKPRCQLSHIHSMCVPY